MRIRVGFILNMTFAVALTACGVKGDRVQQLASPSAAAVVDTVAPPRLSKPELSAKTFNPAFDSVTLAADVENASRLEVAVLPVSGGEAVRTMSLEAADQRVSVQWDGRGDDGSRVRPGEYRFELRAVVDGSSVSSYSDPVRVINKRVIISLDRQELFAYDGDKLIVDTLITTGGPELPTPMGRFHILDKTSPMVAYSPWPKGSPYWFPDVTYQYALEFYDSPQYGLYIHDASWRSYFGPGSNVVDGRPGEDRTGTHGCINVPVAEQTALYSWSEVGTPVIVQH